MSTSWMVICRDCGDVPLAEHSWSNVPNACFDLVAGADALAQIAELAKGLPETLLVQGEHSYSNHFDLSWFLTHRGHKLAVRNGYGHISTECGKHIVCGSCEHPDRCRLAPEHEGPCNPKGTP